MTGYKSLVPATTPEFVKDYTKETVGTMNSRTSGIELMSGLSAGLVVE
jgi:hypothetical protein